MSHRFLKFAAAVTVIVASMHASAHIAAAQRPQQVQLLSQRLDSTTAAVIIQIIDSTAARGLPVDPLVARALEGASRHVAGPRIITVVRSYSYALSDSRNALGEKPNTDEIVAGADVLLTGVKSKSLTDMRSARGSKSLTIPLVVLADLTSRGVPALDAADAVLEVIRTKAEDAELLELQRSVASDITRGAKPASALALRVQGITKNASRPKDRRSQPTSPTPPVVRQSSSVPSPAAIEFGTLFGVHAQTWTHRMSKFQRWESYPVQPSLSAGTWIRYGSVRGSLSLEQGVDIVNRSRQTFGGGGNGDTLGSSTPDTAPTYGVKDSLQTARPITDLTAALQWQKGPVEFQAFAGARFGNAQAPRARAGGNLAYNLGNGVSLTARYERLPNREIALSRGSHLALGLRFMRMPRLWRRASGPAEAAISEFTVTPAVGDTIVIRIRAPRATSVEVIGDVTTWTPTALVATSNGWWEIRLPAPSGVHHLNVRTDNQPWTPPPGIPAIQNAYEGLVGVVVIP